MIVDLRFDRTPFWEALDKLCAAGEVHYTAWSSNAIMIQLGKRQSGPVCMSGPCRFEVTGANRSVHYMSVGEPKPRLSVSMRVPRMCPHLVFT